MNGEYGYFTAKEFSSKKDNIIIIIIFVTIVYTPKYNLGNTPYWNHCTIALFSPFLYRTIQYKNIRSSKILYTFSIPLF